MAARDVVVLNESTPQLEVPQSGDTYNMPRAVVIGGNVTVGAGFQVDMDLTTADAAFFNFKATADGDATSAISTLTGSGGTTHHIQIEINGTTAWIACSTTDPS